MQYGAKGKIHQLVDACDNDSALQEIEMILEQTSNGQDWWLELSDAEKGKRLASLAQLANGHTLSHQQVVEKIRSKFTK